MPTTELGKRLGVAAIGIPLVVLAVYLGGWVMSGVLAVTAAVGSVELCRMAEQRGLRPFTLVAAVLAAALVLIAGAVPFAAEATSFLWLAVLGSFLVLSVASIWARGVGGGPLAAVAVTIASAVLFGGTLCYAVFLRYLPHAQLPDSAIGAMASPMLGARLPFAGAMLVGFPLVLSWVSDSGAYFGGRAFGRRKLIPSVSPGKTVAGAIAGVLSAILAGALYGWLLTTWAGLPLGWAAGAAGGALVSVVAQLGDLFESLLKREAGIKDSGALFPGHGGLFDRVDSLLFAFPAAYWFLRAVL